MSDIEIVEGREYRVQIDTIMHGAAGGYLVDRLGRLWNPTTARDSTITPVVPDEPPVGSVWLDGEGVRWFCAFRAIRLDPENWLLAEADFQRLVWRTWPEVVARGGRLIHDGGAS